MLKTEKLSTEEQLTNQLKNFTIEEAESYLELLLSKSIEAIKKDDLQTYSAIEKTLTESILIFSSRIKNFNLLFTKYVCFKKMQLNFDKKKYSKV